MTSEAYAEFARRLHCDVPYEAFLRNVVVAAGNKRAKTCESFVRSLTSHEDDGVRDAACWAVRLLEDLLTARATS